MATAQATKALTHQQQLDRLQGEVQALRYQLKQAQKLAAVGTMTAMVAHEFNNILTPIINYAQLAQKNPALAGKALTHAADGGQRASQICKAILGVAGTGGEAESFEIGDLVLQTLEAMGRDPRRDGIDVKYQAPAGLKIHTRRGELQQVLLNLLLNARQAVLARNGPRQIVISAQGDKRHVSLWVADNGVGIPPENLTRIFEPFFTTRSHDGQGSGLGLAICREILDAMRGTIDVQSTVGQGTTFHIRLPSRQA